MSKSLKLTLLAVGALALLLGLALSVLIAWRVSTKARLEAAASNALGMEVKIRGQATLRFIPSLGVTLGDVHIGSPDAELLAAKQASLGVALGSLLRGKPRISGIVLKHVTISIEAGKLNFEARAPAKVIEPTDVTLEDASLVYTDRNGEMAVHAGPCAVTAGRLQRSASSGGAINYLAATGELTCEQIRTRNLVMSDVKSAIDGNAGVFEFKPVTMQAYGGKGAGEVRGDFTGREPAYRVQVTLSKLHIEQFFESFSHKEPADGVMDFSANLSMSGKSADQLKRTSTGEASLKGANLTLKIADLDRELSRYDSSQHFTLIDVGAVLVAGPIGLAVTKGYDFARVIDSTGGSSQVQTLISNWQVEQGVAQARDVAMATKENRIALKGGLDFVNGRFQDVTVALLDAKGCPKVEQKVGGSFAHPEVLTPNALNSVTGPARNLVTQAKKVLGVRCDVFYTGSLAQPH